MPVGVSANPTKPFDVNRLTDEQVEGDMDRNTRLDQVLGVSAPRRTKAWCGEVNAAMHSHIVAVPAQRLTQERLLLAPLSVAAAAERAHAVLRTVDNLSCVRIGSARYAVPMKLIGTGVAVVSGTGRVSWMPAPGKSWPPMARGSCRGNALCVTGVEPRVLPPVTNAD